MDKTYQLQVAIVGGLVLILLGSLLILRSVVLQNQHAALRKTMRVVEFALLVGLTGAIANAIQNELTRSFGSNLWGFLVGGGVSALLMIYGEQIIDMIDRLPESQHRDLGMTFFLIGLIIEVWQLNVTLVMSVLLR